jgi:5'-3' exonuclease
MKKYAVEPGMWVDWLSLVGKNDIPGASGIGEITASKLLITFGSYINCLNAIQQVQSQFSDNIAKSLIKFEEQYLGVVKLHRLERTLEVEVVV